VDDEAMLSIHKVSRLTMEAMGHNEFTAMLLAQHPEDGKVIAGPIPITTGYAYSIVQEAVLGLPWVPSFIALSSDTFHYSLKFDDVEAEEAKKELDKPHIPLAKRFAEGDPAVKEALNTVVLTPERSVSVLQTYRYTPTDGWEWDEPLILETADWNYERLTTGAPQLDHRGRPICPICHHFIPNDEEPGAYPGALSRKNNKTEICSNCGLMEALNGMVRG